MTESASDVTDTYNVCMVGGGAVGKSCLAIRYTAKQWLGEYDPTIEDRYRRDVSVDGTLVRLDILDTAGQQEVYQSMQDKWFRQCEGFVFVYSVTDRETFELMRERRAKVMRTRDRIKLPMILIGNKIDLKKKRVVSTHEGQELADEWGMPFFETSAQRNLGVDEAFVQLVQVMRDFKKRHPSLWEKPKLDAPAAVAKPKSLRCVLL